MNIKIWSTNRCPWCHKAKRLMTLKGMEYEEMQGFHPNHRTVPYIEFDGKPLGGFTDLVRYVRSM